jgi:hypothetical protein
MLNKKRSSNNKPGHPAWLIAFPAATFLFGDILYRFQTELALRREFTLRENPLRAALLPTENRLSRME